MSTLDKSGGMAFRDTFVVTIGWYDGLRDTQYKQALSAFDVRA